jgi:hypothetical protein
MLVPVLQLISPVYMHPFGWVILGYRHFERGGGPLGDMGRGGLKPSAGAQSRPNFLGKARQDCPQFGPVSRL